VRGDALILTLDAGEQLEEEALRAELIADRFLYRSFLSI
jgi:hypothetical protein